MPGLRPFSFSAGERKIMNHSVVNTLFHLFVAALPCPFNRIAESGFNSSSVHALTELRMNAPDTFHLSLGRETLVETFGAKLSR